MNYFLLAITTIALSVQSVATKQYSKKETNAPIIYSIMSAISALIVFLVSSKFQLQFNGETLLYSLLFSVCYSSALLGTTIAIANGPLSITALIQSYSLIIPTLYGIVFLNEDIKKTMVVGLALLVISLFAVNYVKDSNGKQKISKKWIIAIIISFIGNGMCSTVQKMQQVAQGGEYKNELMIGALVIAALMLLPVSLFTEKNNVKISIKKGWILAIGCGLANGIVNLLVLILGGRIPVSLLFPVISAGGIILSSMVSVFGYKEKLTKIQLTGVVIGVISIVFLNL